MTAKTVYVFTEDKHPHYAVKQPPTKLIFEQLRSPGLVS